MAAASPSSDAGRFSAIVVAAGHGLRAGGDVPKQYQTLNGVMVLTRTLRALLAHPDCGRLQVVINPDFSDLYARSIAGITDPRLSPPAAGGASRTTSVKAGLDALGPDAPSPVLIHDAARPFVTRAVIDRVRASVRPGQAAFPALPIVDALWAAPDGMVMAPQPRDGLWRAQTPQGFDLVDILRAHQNPIPDAADDVALAHAQGLPVAVVPGDGNNFKITQAQDFDRGLRLLRQDRMDIRTGSGFDVHAFTQGTHVTLCGVDIPHDKALTGHSDADVGMHALTDALFGALAEGDIGQWFPPSDPQWKGAASHIFLEKAVERVAARGFMITHMDVTLICEHPKIGPHAQAMRAALARITGVDVGRVSVKATTSERLGFTGRGEGIAAMATATLVSTAAGGTDPEVQL